MDDLLHLLDSKVDSRLRDRLKSITLSRYSRIEAHRLERTALPHIGLLELVSSEAFEALYKPLYTANFDDSARESADLITLRLQDDQCDRRRGLAPYRIIGVRDRSGQAIAAAQFSVLFLEDRQHVVPYLQYIYVRTENRRQGLSELMHTLVLGVTQADAAELKGTSLLRIPFTLFETEPPVHGTDDAKRSIAAERFQIHSKSGSQALMLKRRVDGRALSAHVQPGLEPSDAPVTYIWALRANPEMDTGLMTILQSEQMGHQVIASYYQSLRDEGFCKQNIALAERIVAERCRSGVDFLLMPLSEVTREMYVEIDCART